MGISGVGLVGGRREGSAESEQFAMGLSMLGLDRNRGGGGNRRIVAGPRSTTRYGESSRVCEALLEGSSRWWYDVHVCFAQSFGCSLSRWRKVGPPLALWQESGPNFKGLPKVSGVCYQLLGFSKV